MTLAQIGDNIKMDFNEIERQDAGFICLNEDRNERFRLAQDWQGFERQKERACLLQLVGCLVSESVSHLSLQDWRTPTLLSHSNFGKRVLSNVRCRICSVVALTCQISRQHESARLHVHMFHINVTPCGVCSLCQALGKLQICCVQS